MCVNYPFNIVIVNIVIVWNLSTQKAEDHVYLIGKYKHFSN